LANEEQNEREAYRVVVLGRHGTEILLVPTGERFTLPSVEIPRWQRVAENLTAAFKADWAAEILCLFELPATNDGPRYVAAEYLCAVDNPRLPSRWVELSASGRDSFIEVADYAAIKHVLATRCAEVEVAPAAPFARLGWFPELRSWIESVIGPMGFHVNGKFMQLNASATFSLVRFETNGPALWFKAVGEPNLREFAITCALVHLFPDYLPPILASRSDWNGWLSGEVQGTLLSEVQEQGLWERAAGALARLQIQSIDRGSQILAAGARDLGLVALSKLIQPFMNFVARLMERQTKIPPAVLDRNDLLALADSLRSSVDATDSIGIPETLGHLDLNPGNIIVSENRFAFLDWAEAYIGNPFFSLEYLLQHARRALGEGSDVRAKMMAAYCAEWADIISAAAVADALALTPLLSVFAYAAGSDIWKQPQGLQEPTAGYLRSLTRRMHREAKELSDRRLLCLQ
jgi:hypothetical protein